MDRVSSVISLALRRLDQKERNVLSRGIRLEYGRMLDLNLDRAAEQLAQFWERDLGPARLPQSVREADGMLEPYLEGRV